MKPLNPIMAALVAASVGAMPLRTLASGTGQPADAPAGRAVANPDDALSRLTELADKAETKGQVRADAATRIGDFILGSGPGGAKFVGAGVDGVGLRRMVVKWAEEKDAASVARLYFVLGPGSSAPSWASTDAKLTLFKSSSRWEASLRAKLEHWTKAEKQIRGGMEAAETGALIDEASAKAPDVLQERRTAGEVETDIGNNDTTRTATPGEGRNGLARPFDPTMAKPTFADLYLDGAEVRRVHKPGEPAREISIRIHTVRNEKGELENQLGIYDITDRNSPIYQTFPLTTGRTGPFRLNDLEKGTRNYELEIFTDPETGERQIFFGRPGTRGVPGAGVISGVSVEDLLLRRADVAAGMNRSGRAQVLTVGGKDFYVVNQGGEFHSVVMLPKDSVDRRDADTAWEMSPQLYGNIGARNSEGRTVTVGGKPHLGALDGKEYHLEKGASGKWEVKEGEGTDKPKPKPPTAAGGDATTAGGATAGGTTGGGARPHSEVVAELMKPGPEGGYTIDDNDNKRLAEAFKGKYLILNKGQAGDKKYAVVVPPEVSQGQRLIYQNIPERLSAAEERRLAELGAKGDGATPGEKRERDALLLKKEGNVVQHRMERAYFAGAYLVLQFDTQFQYLDLTAPDLTSGFKLVGQVVRPKEGSPSLTKFTRIDAAMIAAKDQLGAPEAYLTSVPARVKEAAPGDFEFNSSKAGDALMAIVVAGGVSTQVWPDVRVVDREATGGDYADAKGPGNVFGGPVGIPHSDGLMFPDTMSLPGNLTITKSPQLAFPGAALYKRGEEEVYYLVYSFTALTDEKKKTTAVFRVPPFELFNKTNKFPTARIEGKGLEDLQGEQAIVARTMGGSLLVGSTRARGAYVVWREDATKGSENLKYKGRNCAGAVLWWGMTAAQARDSCKAERVQ